MAEDPPFIVITTHTINRDRLDEYRDQHGAFLAFINANEPRLSDVRAYGSADESEVTFIFAWPDAQAADFHVQVAGEPVGLGAGITETARLDVFGTPGPVLSDVLDRNAARGVPVTIKPAALGGFGRLT